MNTQRDWRIRNREILLLLLPVTIFLFAVGWLLYYEGARTRRNPTQRKQTPPQTDGIQVQIAGLEEHEEYNDQPA